MENSFENRDIEKDKEILIKFMEKKIDKSLLDQIEKIPYIDIEESPKFNTVITKNGTYYAESK